jgi:hypothetical protein
MTDSNNRIRIVKVESPSQWKHLPPCKHCGLPVPWHKPSCPIGQAIMKELDEAERK